MNEENTHTLDACVHTGFGQAHRRPLDAAFDIVYEAKPPRERRGEKVVVCHESEIPEGGRRIVELGKRSIGVFRLSGKLHAIQNYCPHLGAPLCQGTVHGTHAPSEVSEFKPDLAGRVLRCPWHGWEFDIPTGKGLYDARSRVPTFPVEVDEQGMVVVQV